MDSSFLLADDSLYVGLPVDQPFRMRDKEYPFYGELPDFLLLSLQKQGQATMVGYALTDVDARRVGFNLGRAMGHCHREGYEFREPLELLER